MRTIIIGALCVLISCTSSHEKTKSGHSEPAVKALKASSKLVVNSQPLMRPQIPILCYHNIHRLHRNSNPALTVTDSVFNEQLKSLHDSGYHTITPDQLYNY